MRTVGLPRTGLRLRRLLLLAASIAFPGNAIAQDLNFPALPADSPAGTGEMVPCDAPDIVGRARCGTFRVRENREGGTGRTVDIAFVVLEALDSTARVDDAIILLPGGPGETFTNAAAAISSDFAPYASQRTSSVRLTRDMLLVDVRGTGRSEALDCDVPYPGGFRSRFGTVFPPAHAAACRDSLRRRADLDQYTTASSVDDLEELRAWLRYPRLNLLGASYGTRVAQVYIRRHPASVRTVVLNAVAPVSETLYVQHARLLQRTLDRLVTECAADRNCRSEHPEFARRLDQVLERFRNGPVEVELHGETIPFGIGDLSYAMRGLLYGRARELPALIDRAASGDVQALAEYYAERTAWVGERGGSSGYHFSVLCAEDIAPLTDDDVARETAGTFMGAHLIDGYRTVCDQWPYARLPASHWIPVESDIPTLLLSGSLDPVTPPEGAESVARHLSNSLHIVVPGAGHGVGGPCIDGIIAQFIETASIERLDTSCAR
jgi:pimeloyl-ACP methyl ester carboxylesterase